jgi:hypothetical protein
VGSAAATPQPHGAGEATGSRTAGHTLGPGAARFSAPGPEKWPGPGAAKETGEGQKGGKENRGSGKEKGKGKGKGRQEPEAFRQQSVERTASRENQNTPSLPRPAPYVTFAQPHFAARRHGDTACPTRAELDLGIGGEFASVAQPQPAPFQRSFSVGLLSASCGRRKLASG